MTAYYGSNAILDLVRKGLRVYGWGVGIAVPFFYYCLENVIERFIRSGFCAYSMSIWNCMFVPVYVVHLEKQAQSISSPQK